MINPIRPVESGRQAPPVTEPPPERMSPLVFFPLGVLFFLLLWLYLPVVKSLGQVWWHDPNYSHGFLIPLIVAYLVWGRWDAIRQTSARPSLWGGGPLLLGLALLLFGRIVAVAGWSGGRGGLFLQGVSLIVVMASLIVLLLGPRLLKRLAFPLLYLLFMIPLPGAIFVMVTLPLQHYATNVTTTVLQLLGIPAFQEGNLVHLPAVTLGIIEACSGIRSLFTLLAGAIALGYFTLRTWWQHLILLMSVVPVAVVTNALRVSGTGLLAHFVGKEVAQGFFHGFSGWALIVLASVLLCVEVLLLLRLSESEETRGGQA